MIYLLWCQWYSRPIFIWLEFLKIYTNSNRTQIPTACLAISVLVANINYGWDRHIWDMRPEKIRPGIKLALASSVLFAISSLLTKLSLCAFYLRLLAPEGSRFYKSIVWLLGFLSFVCSVSYTFQICFLCK